MQYLFNLVLTTSLYASIVGIVIVIIKGILKNKLNARWHYLIWIVLLLKLVLPFGPESVFSLFNAIPDLENYEVSEIISNNIYQGEEYTSQTVPVMPKEPYLSEAGALQRPQYQDAIPYIWAFGAASMLLWLAVSYLILNMKLRKGTSSFNERIDDIKSNCMSRIGIKRNIPVIIQEAVGMPSLFGMVHPRVLLPPKALELSDKELEYILLHELVHYKHKDIFVNYLLLAFQIIHWFNPVMWYCFKKVREDMELAADEKVLTLLENSEHKAYGRTLLAILDSFASPKLAPKLLAMAGDKKGIEQRLKMIGMAGFFKGRRRLVILIGFACLVLLSGILLTNAVTNKETINKFIGIYNAEELLRYRTEYVGDNVKVVNIIKNMPYGDKAEVSLQTSKKPYGVAINYDFKNNQINQKQLEEQFFDNAAIAFALIQNVDEVLIKSADTGSFRTYTRQEVSYNVNVDLWSCSQNKKTLEKFLQDLVFKAHVSPLKYELTMSSVPGIGIAAAYQGDDAIKKVRYSTETGSFLTWEPPAGKVIQVGNVVELPYGKGVYWSPLLKEGTSEKDDKNIVSIAVLNQMGKEIGNRQIRIKRNGYSYEVLRSPGILTGVPSHNPATIEEAVRNAILTKASVYRIGSISKYKAEYYPSYMIAEKASTYKDGEILTEGHVILGTSEKMTDAGLAVDKEGSVKNLKVYAIASAANFGFQDGIFTIVSGSGAIPTVMTFRLEPDNTYTLLEYQEPKVSFYPVRDVKEMFPPELQDKALITRQYSDELKKQQERQAAEYLKRIGKRGAATAYPKEKWPLDIEVDAINKIFFDKGNRDPIIDNCPYWAGTKEKLENGVRYIYKTSDYKAADGEYVVVLTKSKSDGTVVKQMKFNVKGSDVQQIE